MWIVAGILLAVVVAGFFAGLHVGPHAHVPAAVAGVLAAVWLIAMALLGDAEPLLFVLLGADVTVTAVLGVGAVKVLRSPEALSEQNKPPPSSEGKMGTAVTALQPDGIVVVGGEQWSAVSVNGNVAAGAPVQVIRATGVRLEVWGEDNPMLASPAPNNEENKS